MNTRDTFFEIAHNVTGDDEESPAVRAAAMLVCSLEIGPAADRVARILQIPRAMAREFGRRFRRGKIWHKREVVHSDWFDKDSGGCALMLDAMVGMGQMKKSTNGYSLTDAGTRSVEEM